MRRGPVKPRGADLRYDLKLTLDEAARGGERMIEITRADRCKTCGGSGANPGTQAINCTECEGSGQKQQIKSEKGMKLVRIASCARCLGTGRFIESPCATCKGSGYELLPHQIKMQIPAGIEMTACCSGSPARGKPRHREETRAICSCARSSRPMFI
ncbi:MAG: zinc finger domain-containing protein [Candidatus Binatia bacterium]